MIDIIENQIAKINSANVASASLAQLRKTRNHDRQIRDLAWKIEQSSADLLASIKTAKVAFKSDDNTWKEMCIKELDRTIAKLKINSAKLMEGLQ